MYKWLDGLKKIPLFNKLLKTQLRINMVSGVVTSIINTLVLLVAGRIYLHYLGWDNWSVWAILATVLTFAQLGDVGISQAVMKLVAEGHGRGDVEEIQKYVTTALSMLCISGALVLTVIFIFKGPIVAFFIKPEYQESVLRLLPYMSVLSVYVLFVQSFNSTLSGLGRMDLVNYVQSIGRLLSVIVVIILLYNGSGLVSLLIGSTVSYVFIHIATIFCIRRIADVHFLRFSNLDFHKAKRILHFGGTVFGSSIMGMFLSPFNKLMLSKYTDFSSVGIYELALGTSSQIRGLFETALRPLLPAVSRIGVNLTAETKNKLSQMNKRLLKYIFLLVGPLYCLLAVLSPLLLKLWLKDSFVKPLPAAFCIMLVVTFVSLAGAPAYYTVIGLGKLRTFLTASLIGTAGNFVLVLVYYIVTKHLSVNIVGMCMVVSFAASAVYLIIMAHRINVSRCEQKTEELPIEPIERP